MVTAARALYRLFFLEFGGTVTKSDSISSTALSSTSALRNRISPPQSKHTRILGVTRSPCYCTRTFATTTPLAAAQRTTKTTKTKHPRDEAIPYQWVQVANKYGNLLSPQRKTDVIASLPKGHSLIMVAPPPPTPPRQSVAPNLAWVSAAICRVVDVAAQKKAVEQAAAESKKVAQQTKTLELNWAIAANDLAHRMRRFADFLYKGMRVEIVLARKKGTRRASVEEGEELVRRIQATANDIAGVTEYKKMDGNVGAVLRMYFEGRKKRDAKPKKDQSDQE